MPLRLTGLGPQHLSRRQMLRAGMGLGAFLLPKAAPAAPPHRKARGVILVLLEGGMSHLDTWDPKPAAPREIRGEFGTIATSLPGVRFGEHLPHFAKAVHRGNLLRAVHCDARNCHSPGIHLLLTGYENVRAGVEMERFNYHHPAMGSILAKQLGVTDARGMPRFVAVPGQKQLGKVVKYAGASFLGAAYEAFETGDPPTTAHQAMMAPPGLVLPRDLTPARLSDRLALRASFNRIQEELDRHPLTSGVDAQYQKAVQVLAGRRVQEAFHLDREPETLRESYGDNPTGQALLLARRLVEAGVTYVLVNMSKNNDWDTHANNFKLLKEKLLPPMDRGVSALLRDMDQRRLLDEVIVLVASEMGREPRVSANGGREHWTAAYSVFVAGGGLTRGQVLGSTTSDARYPGSRPVAVPEILATIYQQLGVNPNTLITDAQGRPIPILPEAKPVAELLA